ncbi:MAG: MFS transporter, partial [Rhodospirillaceae bacterium]|nr:MFS transporter [Rhodospirillaceae bacterium]
MQNPPNPAEPISRLARLPFFYGWAVVGIAFVTMAIGVNARTAFSLLFPPILDEFGWTRGAVAGVFSLGFLASMAGAPIVGMLLDRLGPRWVMPGSAIVTALGLVLATLSTETWHFYVALGALVVVGSVGIAYIGHGIL